MNDADEWNFTTFKQYLDALLKERDIRTEQRCDAQATALDAAMHASQSAIDKAMAASHEAINKAEIATEKRFDSVNEFRATLADQATHFLPRTEYAARHEDLEDRFELMRTSIERLSTQMYAIKITDDRADHTQARSDTYRLNVPLIVAGFATFFVSVASIVLTLALHH